MKPKPIAWAYRTPSMGWQLCSEELFNHHPNHSQEFEWAELHPFSAEEVGSSSVIRAYEDGFVKGYASALDSCADKNIITRRAA